MTDPMPEAVYTSDSALRRPRRFARQLWHDLLASRELGWSLLTRNLRAQYRPSVLGYLWIALPTVVTALLWTLLDASRILVVGETSIPYPVYVLAGVLLWQTFLDALNSPLKHVSEARSLLVKVRFPWEALVLAGLGEVLVNLAVRLVVLISALVWFRLPLPATVVLVPVGIGVLLVLGTAIGLALVPAGLLFQDVQRGLSVITGLWFFATPIVYLPPTTRQGALIMAINPVSAPLVTSRDWLTTGQFSHATGTGVVAGLAVLLLLAGWILCRLAMPHVAARLSVR